MTANTWVARLEQYPPEVQAEILEYLTGMDEAGPVPPVKWIKDRLKERQLRAARKAHEQT